MERGAAAALHQWFSTEVARAEGASQGSLKRKVNERIGVEFSGQDSDIILCMVD